MEEHLTPIRKMYAAVNDGLIDNASALLKQTPELLSAGDWLHDAAGDDLVEMIEFLVSQGMDVNSQGKFGDGSPLDMAATRGHLRTARWLLDHGADVDDRGGKGPPIASASTFGHLEMVELLIERGADVNICYGKKRKRNALSQARELGHKKVVELLLKHGAVDPPPLPEKPEGSVAEEILDHVATYFGEPKPFGLREIVPGAVDLTIHHVPDHGERPFHTLVTTGLSDQPMNVPKGGEGYRYAELIMLLPFEWPLNKEALSDVAHRWPIDWLRRVAHYPREHDTWLGGKFTVIDNEDPPQPLAEGVPFTSLLLCTDPEESGQCQCADGRIVNFYYVIPIFREERDLERAQDTKKLLELFVKYEIDRVVSLDRMNVALTRPKR